MTIEAIGVDAMSQEEYKETIILRTIVIILNIYKIKRKRKGWKRD